MRYAHCTEEDKRLAVESLDIDFRCDKSVTNPNITEIDKSISY
ncbi:MAG: hypothetical protein ACE5EE_11400 [Fidelibacterota bacterium]